MLLFGRNMPVASDDHIVQKIKLLLMLMCVVSNDDDVDNNAQLNVSGVVDDSSNNGALMYSADSGRVVYDPVGKFDYLNEGEGGRIIYLFCFG